MARREAFPAPVDSSTTQGIAPVAQVSASRASCPVCSRSMPLTKTGALRVHGPLSNRCAGSGMLLSSQGPQYLRSALGNGGASGDLSSQSPSELLLSPNIRQSVRVLKRIPRASRHLAATKLSNVLDDVSEKNDTASWARLLKFSQRCFAAPRRGGQRRSLASVVNRQLQEEADPTCHRCGCPRSSHGGDPMVFVAKRVSAKLEEGDYRGAVRAACSEDTIADLSEDTLGALREKHPAVHPESCIPSPPPPEQFSPLPAISQEIVVRAIQSFPRGSAGGPDGFRPQHLLDLTSASAERGGKELIRSLTCFINKVLEGKVPPSVQPIFFGATLIALQKKEGGVRPIAVGLSLRRLVAKCAGLHVMRTVGAGLAPLQLGCGVSLGCEAAAHAARLYLQNMPPSHLLLKLDFKNAFNSLRRDKMLEAVKENVPELFNFVHSAYNQPSMLFCGDRVMQSAEGVQQGDPLGPLLFCLAIQPLIQDLQSEFRVFYLDDGTIGGSLEDVHRDLLMVEEKAALLGLQLNRTKTELVCDDANTRDSMLSVVSELRAVCCSEASLLGTPIGSAELIDNTITSKIQKLRLMGDKFRFLKSQDALSLLRHSFAIPKVLYILRTAPCFLSEQLGVFDSDLRRLLSTILNVDLDNDSAWLQATLPVRAGGLGIRRAVQLASSAYLASAAGCSALIQEILPLSLLANPDPNIELATSIWCQGLSQPPPSLPESSHQRVWDAPQIEATYNSLLEGASTQQALARLMAVSSPESGAWLNALPISALGLRMDDDVVRIAVGLRLGVPLCRPHQCSNCGTDIDILGTHGLSCRYSKGRHSRHAAVNDIIKRTLESAKVPCHLEPVGLYRSDGKRPDGASVVPWRGGKILVWDATCPDTLAPSHSSMAVREAGAVAVDAEYRKELKYSHLDATHCFIPIAVETLGAFGTQARTFFREVARRVSLATDDPLAHQFLVQRISVAVQRGNAAAVLGCIGGANST